MKSISTINVAIMENVECSIIKTCAPANNFKVGMLLDYYCLVDMKKMTLTKKLITRPLASCYVHIQFLSKSYPTDWVLITL